MNIRVMVFDEIGNFTHFIDGRISTKKELQAKGKTRREEKKKMVAQFEELLDKVGALLDVK